MLLGLAGKGRLASFSRHSHCMALVYAGGERESLGAGGGMALVTGLVVD